MVSGSLKKILSISERFLYRSDKARNRTTTQSALVLVCQLHCQEAYRRRIDVSSGTCVGTRFDLYIHLRMEKRRHQLEL